MKQTVLVIEDEDIVREVVEEALYASGFNVISAGTLADGLEIALVQPPDMVLCDVILPDGLGFETAQTLNHHPITSHVPVVMMTGNALMRHHAEATRRTMLHKPFAMQQLVDTVQQTVHTALARN